MSRKKWGKSAAKTEKIIRDAVPKPETKTEISEYLKKAKSVTGYDLANRFNIRISVAKRILKEQEDEGIIVPYIRESGFVVYTTPDELEKREGGAQIMTADAFEEIASSKTRTPVITEEMGAALLAAAAPETEKPSRLARRRREAGDRKERRDTRPEIVVEPLEAVAVVQPEAPVATEEVKPKKKPAVKKVKPKEEKPKKKPAAKKAKPKEEKPKKKPAAKKTKPKEEKPKKKPAAKKTKPKEEKPKKKPAAKKTKPKEEKPKKKPAAEKAKPKEEKPKKKPAAKKAKPKEEKPKKKPEHFFKFELVWFHQFSITNS
ncbi:MAG: eS25 family ribosomal protein [Candidatus Thorarchaeota archaeon]